MHRNSAGERQPSGLLTCKECWWQRPRSHMAMRPSLVDTKTRPLSGTCGSALVPRFSVQGFPTLSWRAVSAQGRRSGPSPSGPGAAPPSPAASRRGRGGRRRSARRSTQKAHELCPGVDGRHVRPQASSLRSDRDAPVLEVDWVRPAESREAAREARVHKSGCSDSSKHSVVKGSSRSSRDSHNVHWFLHTCFREKQYADSSGICATRCQRNHLILHSCCAHNCSHKDGCWHCSDRRPPCV